MALLSAEMWHVDCSGGICRKQSDQCTRWGFVQCFAQAQDRKGAQEIARIDCLIWGHGREIGPCACAVHGNVIVGLRLGQ